MALAVALQMGPAAAAHSQTTLHVGPGREYAVPSEAAADAQDGDTVLIDPVDYQNDVASWSQDNLILRGLLDASGGRPHLMVDPGVSAQGKGIWVLSGDNILVENIEFSGVEVSAYNGAGIRVDGTNLTVRNCYFHDNQVGLRVTSPSDPQDLVTNDIVVEGSEFSHNWTDPAQTSKLGHNLYVDADVDALYFLNSYSHHAARGHLLKSRARNTYVLYSRLMDEGVEAGQGNDSSSYLIDLPQGGLTYIIGNLLHQGAAADNARAISYLSESPADFHDVKELYVANNTFVNEFDVDPENPGYQSNGRFVRIKEPADDAIVANNLIKGTDLVLDDHVNGNAQEINNLVTDDPMLVDIDAYDYRLTVDSPAIDVGDSTVDPSLLPTEEYVHPTQAQPRADDGMLDVGSYEFVAAPVCGDAICDEAGGESCSSCEADCGACAPCTLPDDDLNLWNETITEPRIYEACNSITAGSGFWILPPGDVTFRTRGLIILENDFRVEDGSSFSAVIDPEAGS